MRFIKADIYGFGRWTDETFTFNEHGITCIVGENESGKSTLQAFISFILFGLPPKERAFYKPKTSGTLGGQLVVSGKDGERFTIRRVDGQQNGAAICLLSNGETKDEDWLKRKLKGMTAALFASTFQLSTKDIASFEFIESDQIGHVLLHTSISGAPNLHEMEKQLERGMDNLFKPRGERPRINTQLHIAEGVQKQLLDHAHMTETYRRLTEETEKAEKNMGEKQEQVKQEKKQGILWKQLESALPFLQQYERAEAGGIAENPIHFPEKGMENMEEKQRTKQQYNSNMTIIQQSIDRYKTEMESISILPSEVEETGRSILQVKEEWTYMVRSINELTREKEVLRTEITTRLEPFIHAIPAEYVEKMHLPPFIEKKWSDIAKEADTFEQLRVQRLRGLEDEQMKWNSIQEHITALTSDLLSDAQMTASKDQLAIAEQSITDALFDQSMQEQEKKQQKSREDAYKKAIRILMGTQVAAIIFVLCAVVFTTPLLYHGAILSSACGWIWWIMARRALGKHGREEQTATLTEKPDITEEERVALQQQIDAHQYALDSISLLTQQIEEADRTVTYMKKQLEDVLHDEEKVNEQIIDHVRMYPFLDQIELPYWGEIGHVLRDIHALQRKVMKIEERITSTENHVHNFEKSVFHWWTKQDEVAPSDSVGEALVEIEQIVRSHEQQQQQLVMANNEKQEALRRKKIIEEKRMQINQEIESLLHEAAVESEEDFFAQYEKYQDQLLLQQQVEEAKQQLVHIFSPSTWKEYVGKGFDLPTIRYEQMTCDEKVEQLEQQIEKERTRIAANTAELNRMEQTDSLSYSERLHQFEVEKESIASLAKQWATLQVARTILEQTKQTYMETHVSEVVKRTTNHFSFLTDNRYQAIHIHPSGELTIEDSEHIQYTVDELSKGTRDQLYISLRLAMSEHIQEKTPYPFLFDDSFVHFDGTRTERMIQILVQIAKREQILLFTCKDEIEDLVELHTTVESVSWIRFH